MSTVVHFRHKCIGCGVCAYEAAQTWVMSEEDGLASLIHGVEKGKTVVASVHAGDLADNQLAQECCPVRAIKVNA